MNAMIETASPMGGELRMQVGEEGEEMARRLYVTQLLPGMVLSNGTLISRVYRHVPDEYGRGLVREWVSGERGTTVLDNDALDGGPVPAGKVRLIFADGETRDWNEDTRVKILDTVD